MKRLTCALFALSFSFAVGCAEQPGKKKEEDTKSEAKTIDGKAATPAAPAAPAAPAPAAPTPGEAAPTPAPTPAPESK